MKNLRKKILAALMFLAAIQHGQAQYLKAPKVTDFKWLAGTWVGDGFGGVSQETWTEPIGNSMVGVYKHHKDGKSTFFEFFNISETDGKISLKLKHFNPDMTGWEEKSDFLEMSLVRASNSKIEFEGLSYELVAKDQLEIRFTRKSGDKVFTEVFHCEKRDI